MRRVGKKKTQYGIIEELRYGTQVKLTLTASTAKKFCIFFEKRHSFRSVDANVLGNPLVKLNGKTTKLSASNQRSIFIESIGKADVNKLIQLKGFKDVFVELKQGVPFQPEGLSLYLLKIKELSRLNVKNLQLCPNLLNSAYRVNADLTIRNSDLTDSFRLSLFRFQQLSKLTLDNVSFGENLTKRIFFQNLHLCNSLRTFLVAFSNNNRIEAGQVFDCLFLSSEKKQIDPQFAKVLHHFGIPLLCQGRVKVRTRIPLKIHTNSIFFATLLTKFRQDISFRMIPTNYHLSKFMGSI